MAGLPKRLREALSSSHKRSPIQEKLTADRIKGTLTRGSGNQQEKGDVRVRGVARVENKTTKHASFSITVEHLEKLDKAVLGTKEIHFMQVEILGGVRSFVVIPDIYLEDVIEALRSYKT
jgi:hypothetical protein